MGVGLYFLAGLALSLAYLIAKDRILENPPGAVGWTMVGLFFVGPVMVLAVAFTALVVGFVRLVDLLFDRVYELIYPLSKGEDQ